MATTTNNAHKTLDDYRLWGVVDTTGPEVKMVRGANIATDYADMRVVLYSASNQPLLVADDAAFTLGTSPVVPIGALADESAPDSVDEGDVGIPRMTLNRLLRTVPTTAAGSEVFSAQRLAADNLALPTAPDVLATLLAHDGANLDLVRTSVPT